MLSEDENFEDTSLAGRKKVKSKLYPHRDSYCLINQQKNESLFTYLQRKTRKSFQQFYKNEISILILNQIRRSHSRSSNQRSDNQLQTSYSQLNTTTIDHKNDLSFCDDSNKENNSLQMNQSFTNGQMNNNHQKNYSKMKKFHIANSFINKSNLQDDTLSNNSRLLDDLSHSISTQNKKTLNKSLDQGISLNKYLNDKKGFLFDFKQLKDQQQSITSIANQTRETNDMVLYEDQLSYRFKETFRHSPSNGRSTKISNILINQIQNYDKYWNQLRAKAIEIIDASSSYKIKYLSDLSTEFRNIDKRRLQNLSEVYNIIQEYEDQTKSAQIKQSKQTENDISTYEKQIQQLQKQVQGQKKQLDKIEQENEILAGLKRIQEQSSFKSVNDLEIQDKCQKLNSQVSFLKQENSSLKDNMVKQDKEKQLLKEEIQNLKKEYKKQELSIQKQSQEITSLENSLHEAKREQKASLKHDLEMVKKQLQEKDMILDEQVKKLNETMNQKENIRQKQKQQWEEQYKQLKEEIRKLKVENSHLKLENEKAARTVFENKNDRKIVEQYQKQNEFLSQKIKEHKAFSDKLIDAINQIKQVSIQRGFNDLVNPFIRVLEL